MSQVGDEKLVEVVWVVERGGMGCQVGRVRCGGVVASVSGWVGSYVSQWIDKWEGGLEDAG